MERPPLKKRGPPPSEPPPLVAEVIKATEAGGYELKGQYDRKQSSAVRRALNHHGGRLGLRFSVLMTASGGLWIERIAKNDIG